MKRRKLGKYLGRLAVLLIAGLSFGFISCAQQQGSVKGEVVDGETDRPIRGVNIVLRGLNRATATDNSGKFWIRIPAGSKQVLEVSVIGYKKEAYDVKVDSGQQLNVEIRLEVQPIQLGGISVVGTKPIEEVMATYVIGERQIQQTPGGQFLDVLQQYAPSVLLTQSSLLVGTHKPNFTLYVNEIHWEPERYNEIDPFLVKKVYVWKRAFVPIQFKLDYGPTTSCMCFSSLEYSL